MAIPQQATAVGGEYSRSEQVSWYFYDWANSPFSSTVVTLFLGPYLTAIAKSAAGADGLIHPLGVPVDPRSLWGYLVSLSVLLQVIVLPIVGAAADASRHKKKLLMGLAFVGAAATMNMYFVAGKDYMLGAGLFLVANVTFGASIVVYNSFLPQIALPADRDSVSSNGWGLGYLGGGLVLALNLALFGKAADFGLTEGEAVRINLFSAGLWWAAFTLVPYFGLRDRTPEGSQLSGFEKLGETIRGLRRYPQALLFLGGYLVYNDAIQTVISLAAQFGSDELHLPMKSLTLAILMVQFVAFFGAIGFNWIAKWTGAKNAVAGSLVIWTGIVIYMYGWCKTEAQFFGAAAAVAVVMGGSQALSRSLYSTMIPKGQEAEFYSIYEISDKGTSWIGPLVFALGIQLTHSYRHAILSLIVFFVIGLMVLLRVDVAKGARESGQ